VAQIKPQLNIFVIFGKQNATSETITGGATTATGYENASLVRSGKSY
jgi:hypothetical protein